MEIIVLLITVPSPPGGLGHEHQPAPKRLGMGLVQDVTAER